MPTVIFETHATSIDNEAGVATGWQDTDLSVTGESQARALGTRRGQERLEAVYTSDLLRALRTAEIAFGSREIPIRRDWRLRECDYGELTRAPTATIDSCRADHVTVPFPGGESYERVVVRMRHWLLDVRNDHTSGNVLVIGHRATFYALEHLLRGVPLHDAIAAPWQWQPGWVYVVE